MVYVGTLHIAHHANVLEALEAGKPVLCEKPLTTKLIHSRKLIDTARSRAYY